MESTRVVQRPRVLPTSSTPSHVVETQNTPSGTLKRKNTGNASKPRKRKGRAPHGAKKIQQSTSELSPSEARFSQAPTSITNGTEKGLDGKTMTNGSATHARESKGVRAKLKKLNKRAQSWGVFAPGLVTSYTKETMMQPMKGRSGTGRCLASFHSEASSSQRRCLTQLNLTQANFLVADRDKATQECLEELQSLHEQTSRLDLQGNNSLQKTVKMVTHNAEVDYQYCLLYPSDKPFRLPPGPRPPALTQTPKSTRATRQNFWDLVEKSLSGGTLDQLKQQDDFKSTFRSPEVGPSGAASTQEHGSVNNDEVFELLDHITISSTGEDEDKEDDANVREDVIINMQKSPDGDPATERPETSEAAADPAVPLQDVDVNQIERPQAMRAKSESEVEEGETRDSDENPDPGDAMMDYSNSNGFTGKPDEPRSDPEHSSQNFRTLRELGPQELNLQLRYFHLGKNPTEVDMNAAPKCLHCGQGTHDSSICDSLECDKCGKREDHLTEFCPTTTKCPKCREKGHIEKDCPYKLITLAPEEIVCSICQHKNHVEEDCELTWRTSGKPWEFDFSTYSLSVSCYECGVTGHLGNDCPTRRPGKSLGSSTWTKHQRFSVPAQLEKSTRPLTTTASSNKRGELKIKGRAKNHPHNRPSIYNETEKSDFLRPKNVPQPKRSGQIQIGPVQNPMFGYEPSVDRNPVQPQSRNYSTDWRESVGRQPERREYYRDRYDDRSYDRALVDSRWAESRARRRSRSLSPPAMDRRRGRLDDYPSYHRDSRAGGELYRPMPSAAQSAWSRHRL